MGILARHWNGQTEDHPSIQGAKLSTFSTGVRNAYDAGAGVFVPYPSNLIDSRGSAIPANRGWLYDSLSYQAFAPQFADGFSSFINRNTFDHDLYRANVVAGQKGTKPELPETLDFEYRKRPLDAQHIEGIVLPLGDTFIVRYHDAWGPGIHREITFGWQRFADEVVLDTSTGEDQAFRFAINTTGFDWFNGKGVLRDRWDRTSTRDLQGGFELQHLGSGKLSYIRPDFVELLNGSRVPVTVRLAGDLPGARGLVKLLPAGVQARAKYPIRIGTVDSFFSGAGDGFSGLVNASTWALARDASSGGDTTAATSFCIIRSWLNSTYANYRNFFPFDSSSLPDAADVISAKLKLFESNGAVDNADSTSIVFVGPTTQDSFTSLATTDYIKCGSVNSPAEIATRVAFSSVIVNSYNNFILTNLSVVSKTSFTPTGLRTALDVDNVSPTGLNTTKFFTSENAGTSQDPILEVTYTTGSLLWSNMSGGMQNLSGGMHG